MCGPLRHARGRGGARGGGVRGGCRRVRPGPGSPGAVARVAGPPALRGLPRAAARARGRRRRALAGGGRHASRLTRPAASPILSSAT
ncbi:MAG: hypothetical protein DMD80_21795 [Candidatus Rokuibacteriota bacterium]|nr:MAG: hypothetical protein DMD80_21795 [Candidatus Rokubacteria bacterium]PYN23416.1 MAG: hypothetical protein DMD76_17340 [Candidatus Rokubacteria bacterium]